MEKDDKDDTKQTDMPDSWRKLASLKTPENAFEDTLVILQFRNLYDWLDANYLNFNANGPLYEYNPSTGKPFANPLEYQTAKIENFLDIPKHWNLGGLMILQHEQVSQEGAQVFLEKVSKLTATPAKCKADPPKHHEHKQMDPRWQRWITDHANWNVEGRVGYKPWN